MKTLRRFPTLAAAVVISAGCSDAASTGDPLPQADAEGVTEALLALGTTDLATAFHRTNPELPAGLSLAPTDEITHSVTGSRPCEEGNGTVAFDGNVKLTTNADDTELTLDFDYTVTPTNCQVTTESDQQYIVTGEPRIKVSGGLDAMQTAPDEGSRTGSLKYDGGFAWEGVEGGAGGCKFEVTVDYDFEATETSYSGSVSVAGDVCGYDVSYSESTKIEL